METPTRHHWESDAARSDEVCECFYDLEGGAGPIPAQPKGITMVNIDPERAQAEELFDGLKRVRPRQADWPKYLSPPISATPPSELL